MAWKPRYQHEGGYLRIDHRSGPGLPEDVARWSGFDPAVAGNGKLLEGKTLTCAHCKSAVFKNPLRQRARENCPECGNHFVCDFCYADMQHPDYVHMPFEKFADLTMRGEGPASPIRLLPKG